jgi:translation initiation factor 4E
MANPTELKQGCTYHLFKDGVRPEWEDAANKRGGKWVIIPDEQRIDENWLSLLLATIGEVLCDDDDEICGIVVSIRKKQNKITVWTKGLEEPKITAIGYVLPAPTVARLTLF